MDLKVLLTELKELDFPEDEYVVVGSASMAAREIREAQDLDILVTESFWEELTKKYPISKKACEYIDLGNIDLLGPGTMYRKEQGITSIEEVQETAE